MSHVNRRSHYFDATRLPFEARQRTGDRRPTVPRRPRVECWRIPVALHREWHPCNKCRNFNSLIFNSRDGWRGRGGPLWRGAAAFICCHTLSLLNTPAALSRNIVALTTAISSNTTTRRPEEKVRQANSPSLFIYIRPPPPTHTNKQPNRDWTVLSLLSAICLTVCWTAGIE